MLRSVGRNGHKTWWQRLFRVEPRLRQLDATFDIREPGEDVWKALRF